MVFLPIGANFTGGAVVQRIIRGNRSTARNSWGLSPGVLIHQVGSSLLLSSRSLCRRRLESQPQQGSDCRGEAAQVRSSTSFGLGAPWCCNNPISECVHNR